jgi:hypothetical protein
VKGNMVPWVDLERCDTLWKSSNDPEKGSVVRISEIAERFTKPVMQSCKALREVRQMVVQELDTVCNSRERLIMKRVIL